MCLQGCFEGFVELIHVVDDFLVVAICGLFALCDLDLPSSFVCGVCGGVSLCVSGVAYGSDEF